MFLASGVRRVPALAFVHTFVLAQPGHKTTSPQGPPEAGAEVEEGERLLCTLPCGWELKQGCPVPE